MAIQFHADPCSTRAYIAAPTLAKELKAPSLFLIGTADRFCLDERYAELAENAHATVKLVEGADHILERGDGFDGALDSMRDA